MDEQLISAAVDHLERVRSVAMDSADLAVAHMSQEPWLWSLGACCVVFAALWLRALVKLRAAVKRIESLTAACDEQRVMYEKEALWRTASANVDAQMALASRVIDQDDKAREPRDTGAPAPPVAQSA